MYYHYTLNHSLDELLSTHYEIISVNHCSYDANWHSMMHSHDFMEVFYCLEGEGHMQTNFGIQPIQKNDLIILNPYVEHTEHSSLHNPLQYVVIGLRGPELVFPEMMVENDLFLFKDKNLHYHKIIQLITDQIYHENEYTSQLIDYLANTLILMMSHQARSLLSERRKSPLSASVSLAKNYIDNNYSKNITLEQLEDRSHISKFHLSHLFKEELGVSPINYLNEVRFNRAIELLENTNFSIIQISDNTGFNSNHYFSRKFKERYNLSPKEYRKKHRSMVNQ